MRSTTLLELAEQYRVRLPSALTSGEPPQLRATDERGWFRFQRLYDIARSMVRTPDDIRRLLLEAAQDEAADGSGWLEIQVEPSTYARRIGTLSDTVDLILDACRQASEATGVGIGLILAANRTRHPLDARTLARLAARYAGHGVVGFGLSNDERRGTAAEFERAFRIAHQAGLLAVPHAGELLGARSVREALELLDAHRIGHGVRAVEDPRLVERLAESGVTLEICPASNVALGVAGSQAEVPVRRLFEAGVSIALGADDPLLFGSGLGAQYELARSEHGFGDAELAELARQSIRGSAAPEDVRKRLLAGVDAWLAEEPV